MSSLTAINENVCVDPNPKYFQEAKLNGNPIKSHTDLGSQCVMINKSFGQFKALLKVDQAEVEAEILVIPNNC